MTRQEHVQWCKTRALEYVASGDLQGAVASMLSDMGKHNETGGPGLDFLGMAGLMDIQRGPQAVKTWIEGFN